MRYFGRAAVGNLVGTITWTNLGTHGTAFQSMRTMTHRFDRVQIPDPNTGEEAVRAGRGESIEGVIEFVPTSDGTTGQNTKANANTAIIAPDMYAVVTLASCRNAAWNHIFNYMGGFEVIESADGIAKCRMQIHRPLWGGSDANNDALVTGFSTEILA